MTAPFPDIKSFLSSCRLEEYADKFVELGFDDVDFLAHSISASPQQMDLLAKQTNLKPGHIMKLSAALRQHSLQRCAQQQRIEPAPQTLPFGHFRSSPLEYVGSPVRGIYSPSLPSLHSLPSPMFLPHSPFLDGSVSPPFSNSMYGPQSLHASPRVDDSFIEESQLEGQMEDLERSLSALLDGGTEGNDPVPVRPAKSPEHDAAAEAAALRNLNFPPLPPPSAPSRISLSPVSKPQIRTPRNPKSPPSISSSKSSSPSTSPSFSAKKPLSSYPGEFEMVSGKGARRQKKPVREAQVCPEGLFCTERGSCRFSHTKDETLYFKNPLAKTKACTRNLGGVCDKHPDNCNYAHSSKDARCLRCRHRGHFVGDCVQTKTRPCRRKNGGVCDRDPLMCPFAHSKRDSRCLHCKERGHFIDQCPQKIAA